MGNKGGCAANKVQNRGLMSDSASNFRDPAAPLIAKTELSLAWLLLVST